MADKIKIDKGIPIPHPRTVLEDYPIREMEVGDSFLVKNISTSTASSIVNRAGALLKGCKFAARKVSGGRLAPKADYRIWRIK